jgi:hypothetical protein
MYGSAGWGHTPGLLLDGKVVGTIDKKMHIGKPAPQKGKGRGSKTKG